jgi:hypothetical protein
MICLFSGNVRLVHVRKIMTQARCHDGTQLKLSKPGNISKMSK